MIRFTLCTFLLTLTVALGQTPVMSPPIRRVHVNSVGDVLEWQPGLGIVVLTDRAVTRSTKRRVSGAGKAVVETERSIQVEAHAPRPQPFRALPRTRANERLRDEGENLMEEIDKVETPLP